MQTNTKRSEVTWKVIYNFSLSKKIVPFTLCLLSSKVDPPPPTKSFHPRCSHAVWWYVWGHDIASPPSLAGDRTSFGGFGWSFVCIFSLSPGFIFRSCVCLPPAFVLSVGFSFFRCVYCGSGGFLLLCSCMDVSVCAGGFLFLRWCFVFCLVYCRFGGVAADCSWMVVGSGSWGCKRGWSWCLEVV
jgi:hypothetical protein